MNLIWIISITIFLQASQCLGLNSTWNSVVKGGCIKCTTTTTSSTPHSTSPTSSESTSPTSPTSTSSSTTMTPFTTESTSSSSSTESSTSSTSSTTEPTTTMTTSTTESTSSSSSTESSTVEPTTTTSSSTSSTTEPTTTMTTFTTESTSSSSSTELSTVEPTTTTFSSTSSTSEPTTSSVLTSESPTTLDPIDFRACFVCGMYSGVMCVSNKVYRQCGRYDEHRCPQGLVCADHKDICIDPKKLPNAPRCETSCGKCSPRKRFACESLQSFSPCFGRRTPYKRTLLRCRDREFCSTTLETGGAPKFCFSIDDYNLDRADCFMGRKGERESIMSNTTYLGL